MGELLSHLCHDSEIKHHAMTSQHISRRNFLKAGHGQRPTLHRVKRYLPDADGYTSTEDFFKHRRGFLPNVASENWLLRISGLVENPLTLDYAALTQQQQIERPATVLCRESSATNLLMGHARWTGIPFRALLDQARVDETATHVHFIAADGYATSLALNQLDQALLAFGMNGQPLTREHGYPARLIVPGLYGEKMPKWIHRIEFSDQPLDAVTSADAEVSLVAAILSPKPIEPVGLSTLLTGVAFAGSRAITHVEVSIDDGAWMPVAIPSGAASSWTQWKIDWTAPAPGDYLVTVRAYDSHDFAQHAIIVRVTE